MRFLCAAVVVGVLAVAPAAQGAWSTPERVGEPSRLMSGPTLTFAPDGRGLITGSLDPGVFGYTRRTPGPSTRLAMLSPDQAGATVLGTTRKEDVGVVVTGNRTIALRQRWLRNTRNWTSVVRLGISFGTLDAPLGRFVPLERYHDAGGLQLAANARGDAVAMWAASERGRTLTRVAVRRAGGRFGRPRTIAFYRESQSRGALGAAVAVAPDGRMLVAVTHDKPRETGRTVRRVRVAQLRRDGRLGPGRVVGRHIGFASVRLAFAPTGRAVVAWRTQDLGEERNLPAEVWAATRAPGRARFSAARRLASEGASAEPAGGFSLAVGGDGSALLSWAAARGRSWPYTFPVVTSSAAPNGPFAPPQVAAHDGIAGDVALADDGRAIVTWTSKGPEDHQDGLQVFAAQRAPGAELFGPAEPVSPVEHPGRPVVTFDPHTGQPVVAWVASPGLPPETQAGRGEPRSLSFARYVP